MTEEKGRCFQMATGPQRPESVLEIELCLMLYELGQHFKGFASKGRWIAGGIYFYLKIAYFLFSVFV